MTQTRPDLLPFALPDTIGLPFHGLVRNGALTLPDASTMTYQQPRFTGETVLVRGRQYSLPVRTAEQALDDAAKNYQWRDYAILSGSDRDIGGQSLGDGKHLYCDADHCWVVSIDVTPGNGSCKIETWLEELFGVLPDRGTTMTRRKLAEYTWTPTAYDGTAMVPPTRKVGTSSSATYTQHGDIAVINLKSSGTYATDPDFGWYYTEGQHDVIRIVYSGTGSVVSGSVGSGIEATIYHHATAQDLEVVPNTLTTVGGRPYEDPVEISEFTRTGTWRYRYAVQADGTIGYLQRYYLYEGTSRWDEINNSGTWAQIYSTSIATDTFTYFGETYITYASHSQAAEHEPITVDFNGTVIIYYSPYDEMPAANLTGGYVYELTPGLLYFRGTYKTGRVVSQYGHSRDAVGSENQTWYWTCEPVVGTISADESLPICYV